MGPFLLPHEARAVRNRRQSSCMASSPGHSCPSTEGVEEARRPHLWGTQLGREDHCYYDLVGRARRKGNLSREP